MTTKRICYTDGGATITRTPAPQMIALMVGNGGLISSDDIAKVAAQKQAAGADRATALEFAEAIANGGVADEDAAIDIIRRLDVPASATNVTIVEAADLPFYGKNIGGRKCWRQRGARAPEVDLTLAKQFKTESIRPERDRLLAAADVEYIRADESGDDTEKARIVTRKQALRDLPATIQTDLDAQATPEDLENWEPTWPS